MRNLLLFLLIPVAASSQVVTFGIKGGVPFGQPTADFGHLKIDSGHWTVGPVAEFHYRARLSFEVGALYSGYDVLYDANSSILSPAPLPNVRIDGRGETKAWDIPAVVKYRFRASGWTPFVLGGFNYRRESTDVHVSCTAADGRACGSTIGFTERYSTSQDRVGPTFGAGIEWRYGRIRFAPEIRYTRLNRPGSSQYTVLLGVTF